MSKVNRIKWHVANVGVTNNLRKGSFRLDAICYKNTMGHIAAKILETFLIFHNAAIVFHRTY